MISNKLLSSVLIKLLEEVNINRVKNYLTPIEYFDSIIIKDNKVYFHESKQNSFPYKPVGEHTINVYEFAFKCKEWAKRTYCDVTFFTEPDDIIKNFNAGGSELEAIFKACEWLLNNK